MNAPLNNFSDITVALSHIPAQHRDTWVRMAMAVKSELGEDGFSVWDAWSQTASNYNAKAAKSTWKGIKAIGGVTVATLFHEAIAQGWTPTTPHAPPTPEQRAQIESERLQADEEAARITAAQRAEAAKKAAHLFSMARPVSANHPYVIRKGIKPYGAYQLRDMLLIPMRSNGELVNLQIIGKEGAKRFLTGGQVQGTSLVLGKLKGAPISLTAEGWATGCTLHEASDLPVVICFNDQNLFTVAKRMAGVISSDVLVCGDNDNETKGNPGQAAARKAANCFVGGRFILPNFSAELIEHYRQQHGKAPSDYNDLHQLAGLEAVRTAISQVMDDCSTMQCANVVDSFQNSGDIGDCGDGALQLNDDASSSDLGASPGEQNKVGDSGDSATIPAGYLLKPTGKNAGLYWLEPDNEPSLTRICSPLHVEARTRDETGKSWGRLLSWCDAEGRHHQWAMPAAMTCGDGSELAKALVDGGLEIKPTRKARDKLAAYIMEATGTGFVRCTHRTGWHGNAFVLPDEIIAAPGAEKVFLQAERDESLGMTQAGTLSEWRENVASLASGNSRLLFAISLAFAAPLAELAGETGGFHFVGASSIGKTTIQLAAGSVWGNPQSFKIMWRATANGLEGVCSARNDLLLVLDDLGECDGKAAGEAAYMMANGQGKARSTREGTARTPKQWRLLFLSSGEIGLSQHMAEAGKQIRAGQEVRMVDLPAGAGGEYGVFDVLTGGEVAGSALSERVRTMTGKFHGTAGRAFLKLAVGQRHELAKTIKASKTEFIEQTAKASPEGQVMRTVGRFALVAIAGELATAWGLTGWRQGEAWDAAARLFGEWLEMRGGNGNTEAARGIAAVKAFLEAHGDSRFAPWEADDATAQKTINRAGFRKHDDTGTWFYVLPQTYRKELCKGFDHLQVSEALRLKGMLEVQGCEVGTGGKPKRYDTQARLPGVGKTRCYLITPVVWEGEA